MSNIKRKYDEQERINPQGDQQQKTRQRQEAKKQGGKAQVLQKDLDHQVHEHELVELRLTR